MAATKELQPRFDRRLCGPGAAFRSSKPSPVTLSGEECVRGFLPRHSILRAIPRSLGGRGIAPECLSFSTSQTLQSGVPRPDQLAVGRESVV
jgi:hypothetical protein